MTTQPYYQYDIHTVNPILDWKVSNFEKYFWFQIRNELASLFNIGPKTGAKVLVTDSAESMMIIDSFGQNLVLILQNSLNIYSEYIRNYPTLSNTFLRI